MCVCIFTYIIYLCTYIDTYIYIKESERIEREREVCMCVYVSVRVIVCNKKELRVRIFSLLLSLRISIVPQFRRFQQKSD